MNKKAFTLIEMLAVIFIIGLLSGIGLVSYRSFFSSAEDSYYSSLENNILLAGNDYFEDHREDLPSGDNYSEIPLSTLIEGKYIDQVKDSKGKMCNNGKVYAYNENKKIRYEVCLIQCGGYSSKGKYCTGAASRIIGVTSRKVGGGYYNVLASYNSQTYSNGENIEVTFSMDASYTISKYVAINSNDSSIREECSANNNTCNVTLTKTGSYKVVAYDENNKEVTSRYISAKIATGKADFSFHGESKYLLSKEDCNLGNKANVRIEIVKETGVEYQTVKYQINGGEYKEPQGLIINEQLDSGHYDIDVIVSNYSGKDSVKTYSFDVAYLIDYEYSADHATGTFEVVKGKTYNYLDNLPETRLSHGQELPIEWSKNNQIITGESEVVDSCTHKIIGKTTTEVQVPSNPASYCKSLTYNGSNQTLTAAAPANVTFINNSGKDAGSYTVLAHIDPTLYVWSDGTVDDIPFTCNIEKAVATLTCANKTYTGSAQNLYSNKTGCSSVTNGSKTNAGTYTLTCVPDSNHTAPSTCSATMNKAESSITCNSAQNYTGSAITSYSDSSNCGSVTNGSVTDAGTYTVTCNAKNSNYSDSTCSFKVNKVAATLTCANKTYTGSAQNLYSDATGCSSVTNGSQTNAGTYTLTCVPDSNYTAPSTCSATMNKVAATLTCANKTYTGSAQNLYSDATGCSSVTDGSQTNAGTYTLTCNPDENHTAPSTCSATMSKVKCNTPTSVAISTAGKVTWTASSNCSSAQHQISIDGSNWTNASSGVNYNSTIVAATGSRKVYVRSAAPNSNYSASSSATATVTVYSLTLNNKNCNNITGAGNYIKNATVTISAGVPTGNWWKNWTVGTGSTVFSTSKSASVTIDGNKTYKANCVTGCTTSEGNCGTWYNSGYYTNDGKGSGLLGHNFKQCIDDCPTLCTKKYADEYPVKYWSCTSNYYVTPTRAYQTKDYCFCSW